jgi:hypothetical protein
MVQDQESQSPAPTPPAWRFDGRNHHYSGAEIRALILARATDESLQQLTLSQVYIDDVLNLSFEHIPTTLIFDRCYLEKGLVAQRANLASLEFYEGSAAELDLRWSHVDGDLRLVSLIGPLYEPPSYAVGPRPDPMTITATSPSPPRPSEGDAAQTPNSEPTTATSPTGTPTTASDANQTPDPEPTPATSPIDTPPMAGGAGQTPKSQPTGVSVGIRCVGASITGQVSLPGANIGEEQADALVACQTPGADKAESPRTTAWDRTIQALGVTSGLAAWAAVVGGATMWARLDAIGAPALPTLTSLGQTWMITAGLQTLLVPVLLGAAVAAVLYFSRPSPNPTATATEPGSGEQAAHRPRQTEERAEVPPWYPQAPLHRSRPVLALRRMVRDPSRRLLLPVVFLGLVAAGLYVAQASLPVLETTALIVGAGFVGGNAVVRRAETEEKSAGRALRVAVVASVGACIGLTLWIWFDTGHLWQRSVAIAAAAVVPCGLIWAMANRKRPAFFPLAALFVAFSGSFLAFLFNVTMGWTVFMAVITLLALWMCLGALVDKSLGAAALTLFIAIVAWSGALQYARELGSRHPTFPSTTLTFKDPSTPAAEGLLIAGTSDGVVIANREEDHKRRQVRMYPNDLLQSVQFGDPVTVNPNTKKAKTQKSDDANGTGNAGNASADDQPVYELPIQEPLKNAPATQTHDAEVAGLPVRLEILSLQRAGRLTYLWMRVVNMDDQDEHTAEELLGLDGQTLHTLVVVPHGSNINYTVAHDGEYCGCSSNLDIAKIPPYAQLNIWASYTLPPAVQSVDITIPTLWTFTDVKVE